MKTSCIKNGILRIVQGIIIGASAVKGRKVYAFKVTKPQTILIKKKA